MDIILWLKGYLGGISQKEKDAICAEISGGSHPTNEYFTMLVISAIIATTGLLTNNVAVIIGGMLVSPLLMPIIGISLGAVKGDFELFSSAIEAEAKGVAIVIVLVAILTLMVPNAVVTGEILMRTAPTPLDLFVALASGTAAAYALTRKGISAALPAILELKNSTAISTGSGRRKGGTTCPAARRLTALAAASQILSWAT